MSYREFQYKDTKSEKFWMIDLEGSEHTVRYGKVGTQGQSQTKTFDTPALARKSYEKLIAEKLKKGYVEISGAGEVVETQADPSTSLSSDCSPSLTPPPATQSTELSQWESSLNEDQMPKDQLPKDLLAQISQIVLVAKPVTWVTSSDLPQLTIRVTTEDGSSTLYGLTEHQILAILVALKNSTFESIHPLIPLLKHHADRASLDQFIWGLFQRWINLGASSKEKWAMQALGLLGSDSTVLQLTPLIRAWPGESQHPRAVLGLQCLRAIGTDGALMQINSIAQKIKYQGLKAKAVKCMEQLAQERGLSREQLEDRIVPDLDLDERGMRTFDYGPRQFTLMMGADLKPVVRDQAGKLKSSLPKPNRKDDPEKASSAQMDWKLVKKQVQEVLKIQGPRLEMAMVTERSWTPQEFRPLLAKHPLMTHLVQRLVWGEFDRTDHLIRTFRVSEDQTYADCEDNEITLEDLHGIRVVHPLHLDGDLRSTWVQILGDYEIIPPFPQLDRQIYGLDPDERKAQEINRFKDKPVPSLALVRNLQKLGWQRGRLHDHGDYSVHYKYFPRQDITAIIGDYEYVHVETGSMEDRSETINRCGFVKGLYQPEFFPDDRHRYYPDDRPLLDLAELPPLVVSEVLRELHIVIGQG